MICTFVSTTIVGIFLLQVWLTDRRHAAAGLWCLSMWVGSLCTLLFTLRTFGLPLLTVGVGNMLALLGYAFMWAGFRVFDGRKVNPLALLAAPVLWFLAYMFVPQMAADVNVRIISSSLVISAYSLATGWEIWRGRNAEPLPTRRLAAILFATHGIVYGLRIPMAILAPAPLGQGTAFSPWFALFSLEIFAHTILAAVAMLVFIKERGEAFYRQASRTDVLTGIANRGSFLDDAQKRLAERGEGVLMIFDLDRFKAINDTHGHLAGDRVLKAVSAEVHARLEPDMLFCRFGGEEFALFAPDLDMNGAERLAERLRGEIAGLSITGEDGEIAVSVSIGLADAAMFGADFDRLYSAADRALYAAKEKGRNQVTRAEPSTVLAGLAERMRVPSRTGDAAASG